jgi:hypothetical protein
MQNFENYPKLTEYILEMASSGKAPRDWTGFLAELNQTLQLLQTDVSMRSEQFNCGKQRVYGEEQCKKQCNDCINEYEDN